MCFGNQRAFRVLQSWSVRAKEEPGRMCFGNQRAYGCVSEISGHSGCCSPGLCEQKRSQDGCVSEITPGRKFRHAAYNIDTCRGEAESPKTRFTWPAWRSNYFPGIHLYYYIVPGGELCGVALGVYGGKGVNMWAICQLHVCGELSSCGSKCPK